MIRRPPRSTLDRSSAASDVYKRQWKTNPTREVYAAAPAFGVSVIDVGVEITDTESELSLIHISEPTRPY